MNQKPLVQIAGQIQQLDPNNDHVEIGTKLNLGPAFPIAAAASIPFQRTLMTFVGGAGTTNVDEIVGGEDGDILILRKTTDAGNVRVRKDQVNITGGSNRLLNNGRDLLVLLNVSNFWWVELNWQNG